MMSKYLLTLIIIINNLICFSQFSNDFLQILQYETCTTLTDSVKHNWTINKKKNYYQSKFTPSELITKQIYLPCINGIKNEDIKILFGEPNEVTERLWKYYTAPLQKNKFLDSYLLITFNQHGRLEQITETNQKGKLKNIKKNWKEKLKYIDTLGYYQTTFKPQDIEFLEKTFYATDTIKIKRKFGEPSQRINENDWQYHFSNYYKENKYVGEGIKILFKNGKLEKIIWIYSIPLIQSEGY